MEKDGAKDVHKAHRERLRARYEKGGIDCLEDARALEMFLYNSIPVKDTYLTAHALLKKFGSIDGVFSAEEKELLEVEGVGKKTAGMIKFTGDLMQSAVARKLAETPFDNVEHIKAYLLWIMRARDTDETVVMCLDKKGRLIECKNYSTPENSYINLFDDIEEMAKKKTAKIVVAHKHPSGNPTPSFTDVRSTESLCRRCEAAKIELIEHYVVSDYSCYGIVENDIENL